MATLKAIALSSVAAAAIAAAAIAAPSSWRPRASSFLHRQGNIRGKIQQNPPASSSRLSRSIITAGTTAMALGGTVASDQISAADGEDNQEKVDMVSEFMVDMKCEGCVSSVRKRVEPLEGVKNVEVDLPNQVVRVLGNATLRALNEAFEQSGRKARLIGQGASDYVAKAAIVAEFKGPEIFGIVRIAQVSMELARIEASFSGLSKGNHGWSINEYGDLTRGAASTGNIYSSSSLSGTDLSKPVGDLGVLEVDANGKAEFSGTIRMLNVADLPGRALVVYASDDKSQSGIAAAVVARSAGVGENYKKLCTCDGTIIWDSTHSDFVKA